MAKCTVSIPEPGVARYTITEESNTPLLSVRVGDYVNISCVNLNADNRGSFTLTKTYTKWNGASYDQYFEVENEDAVAQSNATVASTQDFLFFRSEKKSLYSNSGTPVILAQAGDLWKLSLPATTQIVSRQEGMAAYLQTRNVVGMAADIPSVTEQAAGTIAATSSLTGTAAINVPTPLIDFDAYDPSSYPGGDGATWTSIGTNAHTMSVNAGAPTFNAGGWMEFNGSSSYKSGSTTTAFPSGSSVRTWMALVWCNAATGSYQVPFGYGEGVSTGRLDCVSFDTAAKPGVSGFGVGRHIASAVTGQWVCVMGRLASGNNFSNVEIFINGVSTAVSGSTGTINTSSSTTMAVGDESDSGSFFTGRVMRAALWDTALTNAQIDQAFQNIRGRVGL